MRVPHLVVAARAGRWNRRLGDFVALGIVTCALMEFCSGILGIRDNVSIVALTLACVSDPVLRLLKRRRAEQEPHVRRGSEVTAIIAAAPWLVLGWLHAAHPEWPVWQTMAAPAAVRYAGCLLAFGVVVIRPLLERARADSDADMCVPGIALESRLLVISLLLVSFSMIAAVLTVYWFAAAGIQRFVASPSGVAAALQIKLRREAFSA